MPGAVPHIRRPCARRDHIAGPVEDVERHAAGRAAVEPVGDLPRSCARHARRRSGRRPGWCLRARRPPRSASAPRAPRCRAAGRTTRRRTAVRRPPRPRSAWDPRRRACRSRPACRRAAAARRRRPPGRRPRRTATDPAAPALRRPPASPAPPRARPRRRCPPPIARSSTCDPAFQSPPPARGPRAPGTSTRDARPGWAGSTFGQGEPVSDRTQQARPRYATGSSRGFGRSSRPTFAHGRPSTTTTSAVKSFAPRISDEPTP